MCGPRAEAPCLLSRISPRASLHRALCSCPTPRRSDAQGPSKPILPGSTRATPRPSRARLLLVGRRAGDQRRAEACLGKKSGSDPGVTLPRSLPPLLPHRVRMRDCTAGNACVSPAPGRGAWAASPVPRPREGLQETHCWGDWRVCTRERSVAHSPGQEKGNGDRRERASEPQCGAAAVGCGRAGPAQASGWRSRAGPA